MPTILHFTATWAEAICNPHRVEVAEAARVLGWEVEELDLDRDRTDAETYRILNVPAVAIKGEPNRGPVLGARPAAVLVAALSSPDAPPA